MQQSINLDRELNYLPYRLRYHSHSRRKPPRTPTPANRRAPSLNNRPQKSRPIMQNLQLEINRRSQEEGSCSSRSGQPFQQQECITTCQTDRVKPSQEAAMNEQCNQKANEWGVFCLQEMEDMKNMLNLDLAEEKSDEKIKTTTLKQLKQDANQKRNNVKNDQQYFEDSEVKTDLVKTTVLLQTNSAKKHSSSENHFQSAKKKVDNIEAEQNFQKSSDEPQTKRNPQKEFEMAQMREAISMKYVPNNSNAEDRVYEPENKQAMHYVKVNENIDSNFSQSLTLKSEDLTINELQKKLQESGLFEQFPKKTSNIQFQQINKRQDRIKSKKLNEIQPFQIQFSQKSILQSKMAELEAKISSIQIETCTISPIKRIQEEKYQSNQMARESSKISKQNVVQIQEGNYQTKDEQDDLNDWKWVQPMTQRTNGNNTKYMRKPHSYYRENIGQLKKEIVETKPSKKQDKSGLLLKKDKNDIRYEANLLNNNLKSGARSSKNDFIKVQIHQEKIQPIKQTISMRPKSSIFHKNEKIDRSNNIIQLQQVKQSINININQQNYPNIEIKQIQKTLPMFSQQNLQIPLAQSPIKPRINFKKALASSPQRSDLLLQSRQSKISVCSSRQNSSGAIPSQSGQNLIYLMGSEHLKELSSLVMEQRNSQIESSDVLSQQLQRVLDEESLPQQISGFALSLDQSLSSSFRFQPQEHESTFNLQAALLEDSLLSPTLTSQTQSVLTPELITFSDLRQGLTAKHKEFLTKNIEKNEETKQLITQQVETDKFQKFSGFVQTSRSKDTDKKSQFQNNRKIQRESKLGNMPKQQVKGISKSGVSIGNKSIGRRDKSRMEKNLSRFKTRINS